MNTKPRSRKLHSVWVTAGERRVITRKLHDAGLTQRFIAELLQVSPMTIWRDLNR